MIDHSRFARLRQPLLPDTPPSEPASPQPRTSISPRLLSVWAFVAAVGATCSAGAALVMLLTQLMRLAGHRDAAAILTSLIVKTCGGTPTR